jgi:hypothetical protein
MYRDNAVTPNDTAAESAAAAIMVEKDFFILLYFDFDHQTNNAGAKVTIIAMFAKKYLKGGAFQIQGNT